MTVGEMMQALKRFPAELPVVLADWNEEYADPTPDIVLRRADNVVVRRDDTVDHYLKDAVVLDTRRVADGHP